MTQTELISIFPDTVSIPDRVLLLCPGRFPLLLGKELQDCRLFIIVTHGEVTLCTAGTYTCIRSNQMIDMFVWEPVRFESMSDDVQAWCLLPNFAFTNEALYDMKPADSESFKDRRSFPLMNLDSRETVLLTSQLRLLAGALDNYAHHYRLDLCRTYFRSFMLEMGNIMISHKKAGEEIDSIENRQDAILRSFLKLVWKYYRSEHNLDFYAEKLCISSKHLSRVVREKLGKTPYAVIKDELLQRASYLLKSTKMSIQDIAADLHFSETASFCKFFKKHHGISPTTYRQSS